MSEFILVIVVKLFEVSILYINVSNFFREVFFNELRESLNIFSIFNILIMFRG